MTGKTVPKWETVEKFVKACRIHASRSGLVLPDQRFDLRDWRARYDRMRSQVGEASGVASLSDRHWMGVVPPTAAGFQRRGLVAPERFTAPATLVLTGLGGTGKTQIAAHLVREEWAAGRIDLMVWINAASRRDMVEGYRTAAYTVAGIEARTSEDAAIRFLYWLATTDLRWVVVLDDVTRPGDVNGLWPPSTEAADGRVVVTTRRTDTALASAGRTILTLGTFTPDEATSYLASRLSGHPHLAAGDTGLAEDLGYLPLALAQATTYLIDRDLSCADYRRRFADRRRRFVDLLPESDALPDDQRRTVAATWSLSVDLADSLNPVGFARRALTFACMLSPHGVPVDLFATRAALTHFADGGDPVAFGDVHDALHCLVRVSLVDMSDAGATLTVHSLVQRTTRDLMSPGERTVVARAAADALLELWPDDDRSHPHMALLRAGAESVAGSDTDALWHGGAHPLLRRAGDSAGASGDVRAARTYFERATQTATRRLGADHPDTLTFRRQALYWRGEGGDPAGAATAAVALIADHTRLLGARQPETLTVRLYRYRWQGYAGDPAAAEAGLRQLVPELRQALGPDHEDTLTARNDHAHFRAAAGDVPGATREFSELLDDRVRVLGPDHPHTLTTRNNLYIGQARTGDLTGALTRLPGLIDDLARILGPDHPHTLAARGNLARFRGEAGDTGTAVRELTELVMDFQRSLGPDHPFTLQTHKHLSRWQASHHEG